MKHSFGTTLEYSGQSVESSGAELERAYAELFGCDVEGGIGDAGVDLRCHNIPEVSVLQVKSNWQDTRRFLAESIRRKEFIPVVVGDFGQHTKEEILESIRVNGGWVSPEIEGWERVLGAIKSTRDMILKELHGRQKSYSSN